MKKKAEYKFTKMIWKGVAMMSVENLILIPFPSLAIKWERHFPARFKNVFWFCPLQNKGPQ